jgi:hypothetical protein
MAVVVEQTIPFAASTLDLHSEKRWTNLFPLLRPSVKAVQTAKGQNILLDNSNIKSKSVHVVAIGSQGNFSSKLLDDHIVTALVTEHSGAGLLTAEDVYNSLRANGAAEQQGVVVARIGKQNGVEAKSPNIVEVVIDHELGLDHILHLLGNATESCRSSIHHVSDLLKLFVKSAATAHSKFHVEKADGNPAIVHVEGASGFSQAKHALQRDLDYVLKSHAIPGDATYSVHYSDTNGLSRLENYIIAGEIAQYLGEIACASRLRLY